MKKQKEVIMKNQITKAYKVFDKNLQCKGFQYKVGKTYKLDGTLSICNWGFHACLIPADCFSYYDFKPENRVCEVEMIGEIQTHADSKIAGLEIKIIRELTWVEVLSIVNSGSNNTGYWNSGNQNSGNRNSGDGNSGDRNSGNWNSGDWNSGDWNSGDQNSGDWNSGNQNSGNRNSGDWNSGNQNSGNQNSGNQNSGNRNSGFFNSDTPPVRAFNGFIDNITHDNYNSLIPYIRLPITEWINSDDMTDQEKKDNPFYETTQGYLKTYSHKEAWSMWWNGNSDKQSKITSLPGFDTDVFFEITGIRL